MSTPERVAVAETRYDPKSLAIIAEAFDAVGFNPRKKSALIAETIDTLANLILEANLAMEPDSLGQALDIMAKLGYGSNFSRSGRGAKLLADKLSFEELKPGEAIADTIPNGLESIAEDAVRKMHEGEDP